MCDLLSPQALPASGIAQYEAINRMWQSDPCGTITPPSEGIQEYFLRRDIQDPNSSSLNRKPVVAVVGVGYVGVRIVESFALHYEVIGYDLSEYQLKSARAQIPDTANVSLTTDPQHLAAATHFLVAVPTLVTSSAKIDTTFIRSALATVAVYARAGSTVVIESSVSVGMTRALLTDICCTNGLKAGMSPERVDPGRISPAFQDIPKIVSGLDDVTPESLESIFELYRPVFSNLIPVSSPEVAEMTKLYENCQRMLCIAFANEMADACEPLGIDPFEVSRAAATKPFGYLPMSPSAGVGGHCIPVNPHYLFATSTFPLLSLATTKMADRPSDVASKAAKKLRQSTRHRSCPKHRALVVGMGFKPGQAVMSHSPGRAVAESLDRHSDIEVHWADPLVEQTEIPQISKLDTSRHWTVEHLNDFSLIIIVNRQTGLDFDILHKLNSPLIEEWQR